MIKILYELCLIFSLLIIAMEVDVNMSNLAQHNQTTEDQVEILTDIQYICKSTSLITESLRNGKDIARNIKGVKNVVSHVHVK